MKKLVLGLMALVLFAGACHFEHNYTRHDCEVVQICDGIATFEDKCGFYWDWEIEENEYFEVGDLVDLKMYDKYTSAYVGDDVITKIVFHD